MNDKLGFGTMRLPVSDSSCDQSIDTEIFTEMIDRFINAGFFYFDTALFYCGGNSEIALRKCLVERYQRHKFWITDKLPSSSLLSSMSCENIFQTQLQKLGLRFFDCYMLHNVNSSTLSTFNAFDAFSFVAEKKKSGEAKTIGFSFHDSPELLDTILTEHPEIDFVQLQINYLDWEDPVIQSKNCYNVATKHEKPVIVMEPIKGGSLAQLPSDVFEKLHIINPAASSASWALRFAASLSNVRIVLSGMSNAFQVNDNIITFTKLPCLSIEEKQLLSQVAREISGKKAIPCSNCAYCVQVCKTGIPIPQFFALYNADCLEHPSKKRRPQRRYYKNLSLKYCSATRCILCKRCEQVCPQKLPIVDLLVSVASRFED